MSCVYAVAQIDIQDPEAYQLYGEKFMPILAEFGGKLLGLSDPPAVIEGRFEGTRAVLLEFPSREAFDTWYNSDAYQAILKHRLASSVGSVILLNGLG